MHSLQGNLQRKMPIINSLTYAKKEVALLIKQKFLAHENKTIKIHFLYKNLFIHLRI